MKCLRVSLASMKISVPSFRIYILKQNLGMVVSICNPFPEEVATARLTGAPWLAQLETSRSVRESDSIIKVGSTGETTLEGVLWPPHQRVCI